MRGISLCRQLSSYGAYDGRYLYLTITETVDKVNNRSTLAWSLHVTGGSSAYYSTGPTTVKINGTQVYYKARTGWDERVFPAATGSTSGTIVVPHDTNGTKTIKVVFQTAVYYGSWAVADYGGNMTLTAIDRTAPTVSAAATVVSTSSITIKGTANKTCNKWEYSLDGGSSWTSYSTTSGTSASKTLTGLTSKNYTSIKIRATRSDNGVSGTSSGVSADITAPTASFTASNITASSVYINAKSSVTANLWQYSINNGSTWTQFSTAEGASATTTITGLSPNTTYQIKVRVRKKSNSLYGESAATSVKTLGASVLNSVNNLTVDVTSPSLVLNWTVYAASYTHSLAIKNGSTTILTITGLSGSTGTNNKTVTLTSAQRTTILNAMSAVQSLSVTYVLTTYSGSTQIGTTSSVTGTIKTTSSTSAPTFTEFTFLDNNSTTVGVTGSNQLCIQSYSSLQVTCTAATAKNGASISKYRATIGTKTAESTSTTISFGTITDSGNLTLTVTAIDSRGYTKSVSKNITVIAYERIVINSWSIRRINNVEETIQLSFNGSLSPVSVNDVAKNSFVRARYRYKRTTATSYNSYATMSNVESDTSGFSFEDDAFIELPAAYSYHIQIEVSDELDTYTVTLYIDKGTPLVAFRSEKVGINTNDPQAALDVSGDIMMNGYNVQGYIGALDSTTDLNDILTPGIYYTSMGKTALNYPVVNAVGVLEVIQVAKNFVLQRYTSVSGQVYNRGHYDTTWHAWA